MLNDSDVVLEVGAGIGFLSSYCARVIGSDRVFTFEANPLLESLIKDVYAANEVNPTLKIGVLGREAGSAKFYITRDFWASSLLPPAEPCEEVSVLVYDLNEEVRRINPTFLLMDIEGGEYDLIKAIDFHTIRKISVEIHTDVLGQGRVDEIKAITRDAGFVVNPQLSSAIPGVKEVLFLERPGASK
jgi:FkbM family methyltransferase